MFQTVIRKLVSNAIKFTPGGGNIKISAQRISRKGTEISISDTGIGMDKSMLDSLFMINARINRVGTEGEPSSGLGLILCKDFIEKHNGKIRVNSEINRGTTFYFTLNTE